MKVCLRFSDFHILKYCQTWLNIHTYGEFATWETSHILEKNLGKKKQNKKTLHLKCTQTQAFHSSLIENLSIHFGKGSTVVGL